MKKLYSLIIIILPVLIYGQTTDLLISKYGEGSSNNKFIEIYNGTGADVDLSNYSLSNCNNGCDTQDVFDYPNTLTFNSGAIISHGDVYVIAHPSADDQILAAADQTHNYLSNGDDAYALTYIDQSTGDLTIIDILGDMNENDIGSGWDVAGVSNATNNHTLTRKSTICSPNPIPWGNANDSAGTNEEDSEWIVTENNSGWDTLGSFISDCVEDISLTITTPQDGYTYPAGTSVATINFTVSNFNVGASGDDNVDGHVHWIYTGTDGTTVIDGSEQMVFDTNPIELQIECGFTYTVMMSLADDAHQPLDPPVETSVTFSSLCANCVDEGSIIITEILNNAEGDDDGKEWFEVFNTTDLDIDMENWTITDEGSNSITINGSLIVPAQGYTVLGEETDTSINGGAPVDYGWGTNSNLTLGNGNDEIIISCGTNIIDQVAYDNGDTFPDEGGYSMQLLADSYNSTDNDIGSNWVVSVSEYGDNGDHGTPGQEPQMGIDNTLIESFKIYPNPVNSGVFEIIIENNQDASFNLYNILGEKIISNNSILQPIKIGDLQSGIYLIEVYKNNQSIVKKLIVN